MVNGLRKKSTMSKPKPPRKVARIAWLICLALLLSVLADYLFYPWNAPMPGTTGGNREQNGVWLKDAWYFGERTDLRIRELARDLEKRQIRDAFFHVRYIGKSGNLRYRHPAQARHLNAVLRQGSPNVRRIAWVYIGNTRGAGSVTDLTDPDYRRRVVSEARFLVVECGFDGVQWDYEICPDNDGGLLSLLDETRAALPPGAVVSVATPLWSPDVPRALGYGWSETYFAQVAKRADQICVMGYDSGLYLPRAYVALMEEQVVRVCRAATGTRCRVLIGVPTYSAGGLSHHARTENLAVAVRGVRAGVARLSARERETFAGIAPFAEYTTDANEWETYRRDWLE